MLTVDDLARLAANAGWTGNDLVTAVAVSMAEDGRLDPTAVGGPNDNGSYDYGLWQINDGNFGGLGLTRTSVLDAQTNANAAYRLWSESPRGWRNWTTYTSATNNYMTNWGAAQAAVAALGGGAGGDGGGGAAAASDTIPMWVLAVGALALIWVLED